MKQYNYEAFNGYFVKSLEINWGINNLKEYNVNGLGLVPSAWNILRKLSRDSIIKFSNQIKYIEFGSAYLAKEEKKFISESFPDTNLVMHYGLTELSRALFINFHEDDLGAIGKLQKNVSVKLTRRC